MWGWMGTYRPGAPKALYSQCVGVQSRGPTQKSKRK